MNVDQLLAALETGLTFVKGLTPLAALGGPIGVSIGAIVSEVDGFALAALDAATAAKGVLTSTDQAKIQAAVTALQAENAALAAQIAAS